MNKKVIYTVLTGEYEILNEPIRADWQEGIDFICFTNMDITSDFWRIVNINPILPFDMQRSSRQPKILFHNFLQGYESSVYVDNSVLLLENPFLYLDRANRDIVLMKHSFHQSLLEEFSQVYVRELDSQFRLQEQFLHYKSQKNNLDKVELAWCGVIFRRHNKPEVEKLMNLWWTHFLRYSRRDQLSFAFLADICKIDVLNLELLEIDNHESIFHKWPVSKRNFNREQIWRIDVEDLDKQLRKLPSGNKKLLIFKKITDFFFLK